VEAADVDIAIARNWVRQALIQSSHALTRSEDGRDGSGNSRVLDEQRIEIDIDRNGLVRQRLNRLLVSVLDRKLLRRRGRAERRAIDCSDLSSLLTLRD
jgi:hypothetical protein